MRSFRRTVATLVAGALFAGTVAAIAAGPSLVGKAAPEIQAAGFFNSEKPVTLESLKGKPAVVEFWATWCPPCRKSIPHLAKLHEKHAKSGLVIVGLTREDKGTVEEFMKETSMPYIVGYGSKSGDAYGVDGIPTAYVVGADGKVTWGGHPMDAGFEKAIEEALAK